jgi:hypothetical protein
MAVHDYKARPVTALQYRRGVTTRTELLQFCPGLVLGHGGDRPVVVAMQSPSGMTVLADGDYIVCCSGVHYRWAADEFEREYEEAS